MIETNSGMNNIYQSTTNKLFLLKEKNWTIPLLLESLKNKDFYLPEPKNRFLNYFWRRIEDC